MVCRMTDPLFHSVDCVRFYVPDLEAGLAFYRDKLGHELLWRIEEAVGLRIPNTQTEIVLHTQRQQPPDIDFKVQSADQAAQFIEETGGKIIVPPFDIQIGRCAVVADPWGNQFIVLDWSKGLFVTDEQGNVIGNAEPDSDPA